MNVQSDSKNRLNEPALGEALFDLIRRTACDLPADVERALRRAHDEEAPDSRARTILSLFLENVALAREKQVPLSQRATVKACEEAVARATREQYLRPNAVDPVTGRNSGNSVGAGIPGVYFEEGDDEAVSVVLMLKGGGSENVGRQYSLPDDALKAGRDLEGVRRVILDAVRRAEGKGCAPGILGICIGGDRGSGYLHSKHQLLRPLDDVNPDPALADLEKRIIREANTLGIGPLGLGGKTTLLGAKVGALHRVPACYFVTVTYMCWEYRRREIRIDADGTWRFTR
jgi:fumarate hydratase class I